MKNLGFNFLSILLTSIMHTFKKYTISFTGGFNSNSTDQQCNPNLAILTHRWEEHAKDDKLVKDYWKVEPFCGVVCSGSEEGSEELPSSEWWLLVFGSKFPDIFNLYSYGPSFGVLIDFLKQEVMSNAKLENLIQLIFEEWQFWELFVKHYMPFLKKIQKIDQDIRDEFAKTTSVMGIQFRDLNSSSHESKNFYVTREILDSLECSRDCVDESILILETLSKLMTGEMDGMKIIHKELPICDDCFFTMPNENEAIDVFSQINQPSFKWIVTLSKTIDPSIAEVCSKRLESGSQEDDNQFLDISISRDFFNEHFLPLLEKASIATREACSDPTDLECIEL
jgi:hypothetical protein